MTPLHLPALTPARFESVQTALPGSKGWLRVNGQSYLHADLALQRPTGKYVSRLLLGVLNVVLAGVRIRTLGHNAMPGLLFPQLDGGKGIAQVPIWPKGYKVLVANVLGRSQVQEAIVVPAEPFMVLPVRPEWQTFDDYLGAMSTKYRTRAKKSLKLAEGCEQVDLSHEPVHSWVAWASYLLKQTLRDKTVTLPASLDALLKTYKEELGDAFRIYGYRKDGHWVGFITAIVDEEAVHAMHMGFEPEYAQQAQFYQRSMMDLVKLAIDTRKPLLNMGRTATEIKSTMGAVPVENSFVFFSPRPLVRALLRVYARSIHRLPEYTLRSPFKA
ncbi:MAG: hypothetical protein RL168_731 [Bacteroidota bacterium]